MILVDTSIWIDHFRKRNSQLDELLGQGRILMHPFVLGELAMGQLSPRAQIISDLNDLPHITAVTDDEVLEFISAHKLFGLGIGYVDAHLLAAVRLTPGASLMTRDKRLNAAAENLVLTRNGRQIS